LKHHLGVPERDFRAGEFALVIFIAFSWSIIASVIALSRFRADAEIVAFTDDHLWGVAAYEIILAPILVFILRQTGWRWKDFHVHYSNAGTIVGIALGVASIALMTLVEWAAGPVRITMPSASLVAVFVVSLLNPWYEELLVCAYVIEALRKRFGLVTAINASIALRLSYHLYQGPPAFIVFAIFGLLVTLVYVRTGRLWPVIVGHSIADFVGLAGFEIG
jgi:membrane protease YdiL (CAAX protease family)